VKNTTKAPAANKATKVAPATKATITPIKEQMKNMKKIKANIKKSTKVDNSQHLTINAAFKKEVTKIINANKSLNNANEKLDTVSLNMFNLVITNSIAMKKEVVISDSIKDINDYKYNQISKALKDYKEDAYYHKVIDNSIHYLKSGYSVSFLDSVKMSLITKLLNVKPTKNKVKECKDNKELEILINTAIAANKTKEQKNIKDNLSTELKELLSKLSDSDKLALKAYYTH